MLVSHSFPFSVFLQALLEENITREYYPLFGLIFTQGQFCRWGIVLAGVCVSICPGDIDMGQHWFRWWLGAIRHQAITWTNVDFPLVRFHGIHLRALSNFTASGWVPMLLFCIMILKIVHLRLLTHRPGASELILWMCWEIMLFPGTGKWMSSCNVYQELLDCYTAQWQQDRYWGMRHHSQ